MKVSWQPLLYYVFYLLVVYLDTLISNEIHK